MANVIKPKRSNTAAAVPTTGQLAGGEIAVNMADRKIWINNGTAVVQVGAGNLGALGDVTVTSPSNGEVLKYNTSTSKWENGGVTATTATNVSGGGANQILYQTASSTTSFITAPTTTDTYLKWTGSAFSWATVSGSGDMTKAIYDTNNDGVVDSAAVAAEVPWSGITGKPTFATVATSGSYSDLSGTPVIGVNTQAWSANLDSWSSVSTSDKQNTLISGTNIKSVNNTSLLGSGNLAVQEVLQSQTNIKSIDGTSLLGSGDYSVLPIVGQATGDIHGIVTRTDSTISFNEGTRTFTVAPVSTSWTFYNKGTLYTVSTSKSIQIADTSGARFIRINPSTLNLEDGGPIPDFTNDVVLAYIYWNATTQKCIILGDERHGSKRDTTWHSNQHLNVGTVWRTGGALGYTLNNASSVALDVGTPLNIADEDLLHQITHSATPSADYQQILNTAASLEVLYLSGTSYAATTASTTPWVAGTSLARYNQVVAGSGSLVDATEGSYITYWLLATNDTRRPVKLVLGRVVHSSLDDAYAEDFVEYGLSFAEQVFMYQIVVQTSASYTQNAAKIVIAAVRRIQTKLASSVTSLPATEHNQLTGRDVGDAHTIGAITGLQSALNGKQATLENQVNIKSVNGTSLLGSGDLTVAASQSVSAAVTAGTNAQGQGALTSDYNVITTTPSAPSAVTLPTATAGRTIKVVNKGTNVLNIYPATGAQIDSIGTNLPYDIPVGAVIEFNASTTTQWYSTGNTDITRLASTFINEFTSTATAGATTTLTNDSNYYQEFTGTQNQTITLPSTATLAVGWTFEIINNSTGTLTIQTSTAVSLGTVPTGLTVTVVVVSVAGNTAAAWEFDYSEFNSITGTGSAVLSTAPTITRLSLAAGTATAGTAPLKLTTGVNLTAVEAGAVEYDGVKSYITSSETGSGRSVIDNSYYFYTTAAGANLGPAIADLFVNAGFTLQAGGIYAIEWHVYITKNTAGTVTFTVLNSQAPQAVTVGIPGVLTGTTSTVAVGTTATALALPVSASIGNNSIVYFPVKAVMTANATTGGNVRLRVTSSAGTVTLQRGSHIIVRRLPGANTGNWVA